jgi:sigma-B regulation protein RsbU (phosphoserine phosphatase)
LRVRLGLLKGKAESDLDATERSMLEHELAIARDLQAHLLPRQLPEIPCWDVAAYYKASRDVGGDYYDFFPVDEQRWGIVVADVSGKGIPASLLMSETRVLMRTHAVGEKSPREVLSAVNRFLYQDIMRGMFVTLFYCVYEPETRILTMCSAGHNPLIYYCRAKASCYLINPPGIALGLDRGPIFDRTIREQRIKLQTGDRIVLYTDGAVEVFNRREEPYAQERLYRLVRERGEAPSSDLIRAIIADIDAHRDGAMQHDDITLVSIRIVPAGSASETMFGE